MSRKKEAVVAAGRKLFLERGIAATSMEQIADAAPVSKMTIYNYFQSKEGLVEEIVGRMVSQAVEDLQRLTRDEGDPMESLMAMSRYEPKYEMSDAFVSDLLQGYPELAKRLLEATKLHVMPVFEEVIFRAQREGTIRKDLSPHVIMLFTMALKEYFSRPDVLQGLGSLNAVGEQVTSILYHGIIADEGRKHIQREGM